MFSEMLHGPGDPILGPAGHQGRAGFCGDIHQPGVRERPDEPRAEVGIASGGSEGSLDRADSPLVQRGMLGRVSVMCHRRGHDPAEVDGFQHQPAARADGRDHALQRALAAGDVLQDGTPLADLFAGGAPLADVLTILSRLRNTVHGQAIQATMRQNGQVRDAPIKLPAEHESQVLASMDNLGGRAAWGAQPGVGGGVAVDPGQFVEQLFPAVLWLLNAVMTATPPVYVRGQQPHPDSGPRWYSERNRLSVSWQLGF